MQASPDSLAAAEKKNDTERGAGAIRRAIGKAQADVVKLWAKSDVARHDEINAATCAPGKSVRASSARGKAISAYQCLDERRDALPAICRRTRAAEERVGAGAETRLRQVVHAEVPGDPDRVIQISRPRDTPAVSVGPAGKALTEVGVTEREVRARRSFLCACQTREAQRPESQPSQFLHLSFSKRCIRCVHPRSAQ